MTSGALLLDVVDLDVTYSNRAHAVRAVSFQIRPGTVHVIVGESGCGKSTVANALLGMLPARSHVQGAARLFDPTGTSSVDLLHLDDRTIRELRGRSIGYVAQDPYRAFDPLRSVGHHVASAWRVHGVRPPDDEVDRRLAALSVEDASLRSRERPHRWSGGMLQRATIAAATAWAPPLVIADEPTSALDAELARSTLQQLRGEGRSTLLITHDLSLAEEVADDITVLYAGEVVEQGSSAEVLGAPRHPYTVALAGAVPRKVGVLPTALPGIPPNPFRTAAGCAFAPRCPLAIERCQHDRPLVNVGVACHVVSG